MPRIQRKQSAELWTELFRAFYGLYLDMGISPSSPRLFYVNVLRAPLNLYLERFTVNFHGLQCKVEVVVNRMMSLAATSQMPNSKVFKLDMMIQQPTFVPDGKRRLLESSWLWPLVSIAPVLRTDESTDYVVSRNWHSVTSKPVDEFHVRRLWKTLNQDASAIIIDAGIQGSIYVQLSENEKPIGQSKVEG